MSALPGGYPCVVSPTQTPARARAPRRIEGYAPIRDYAAIGNKRTVALVALDGSIDWLPLPRLDCQAAFSALLDSRVGGRFALAPEEPFTAERRYVTATNVLETTFHTPRGVVRVTDALSRPVTGPLAWNELVRRVDVVAGEVSMRWAARPRFEWGSQLPAIEQVGDTPVLRCGGAAIGVQAFDAGEVDAGRNGVSGAFVAREGDSALIALSCFHGAPILLSRRDEIEDRLGLTVDFWRSWCARRAYDGPWQEAVERSALALELLTDEDTRALAAAATTSLPEAIGGDRNFDYRYGWLRDTSLALDAFTRLGRREQVHDTLGWVLGATRHTGPRLHTYYHLDGRPGGGQVELALHGYRGSRPVLEGNGAGSQLQLGNWSHLLDAVWRHVREGNALDPDSASRLADAATLLHELRRHPDASIWELGDCREYTQSKLSAWVALDRAVRLADAGRIPARHAARWRQGVGEMRALIEQRCWSEHRRAYTRAIDGEDLDASVLLMANAGFAEPGSERLASTIRALRTELGTGPLLYRYSGMQDEEGAFLACSFWLVEALVEVGQRDDAAETMDALVDLGNDVGLLSEEIDPSSGALLGNFPQALTHLALINAATAFRQRPGSGG